MLMRTAPLRELRGVLERHARDPADDLHGILDRCDRLDRVQRRPSSDLRRAGGRSWASERLVPALELRGAERLGDEVAVLAVLLAVHREDEVAHELADVLAVDRRRERLGIAQRDLSILVTQDLSSWCRAPWKLPLLADNWALPLPQRPVHSA